MGMYTAVRTEVVLAGLTRAERDWLIWTCWGWGIGISRRDGVPAQPAVEEPRPTHHFFNLGRRSWTLTGTSAYFGPDDVPTVLAFVGDQVELSAFCSLKNYEGEIETWCEWIATRVVSGSVSWRHERNPSWSHRVWLPDGSVSEPPWDSPYPIDYDDPDAIWDHLDRYGVGEA